ncbi:aminodeoxychorismate synthase component I [Spirochaeta dissipatitropha]
MLWTLDSIDPSDILYSTPLGSNLPLDYSLNTVPKIEIFRKKAYHEYLKGFSVIHEGQLYGESFLANLTYPVDIRLNTDLKQVLLYARAPYRFWLKDHFCVFSPESFIRISSEGEISTYPMKGTILASEQDAENSLLNNPKEAAEHLTVVDLLRNDLGSIASEIEVRKYRYLEHIQSDSGGIIQASSEIIAQLGTSWKKKLALALQSMLPAGSISGAPKKRTMELIRQAEGEDRGYYTGILGFFDGNEFCSAVMIRFIEQRAGGLSSQPLLAFPRFRAGGGITIYSDPKEEYAELHAKIRIPHFG